MFKSIFPKNSDTILAEATDIAFDAGHFIKNKYEDLDVDSKLELFLFNYIHAWLYLQETSLVKMNEEAAKSYLVLGSIKAGTLKKNIDVVKFYDLFKDRFMHHTEELKVVTQTQFTADEYFPKYFYVRLYKFPLQMNDIRHEYYEDEDEFLSEHLLTDMYKHQILHVQKKLQLAFKN